MRKLTDKQKNLLAFIERFIVKEGMAPTVYEISEHFRIKTSTVFSHLRALQKKGQISRSSKARSISILHQSGAGSARETVSLPLLDGDAPRIITLSRSICEVPQKEGFAFRAKDDSMREHGIFSGDLLVATPRTPAAGDLVAVEKDGNLAVCHGHSVPVEEVKGVVTAMIRKF